MLVGLCFYLLTNFLFSFSAGICRFSLTLIDTLDTLVVSTRPFRVSCDLSAFFKYDHLCVLRHIDLEHLSGGCWLIPDHRMSNVIDTVLTFHVWSIVHGDCFSLFFLVPVCVQVLNKLDEFEDAVRKAVKDVRLDNDVVVSVFETNIRVLGYKPDLFPLWHVDASVWKVL